MRSPGLIAFDLDGTLIDSLPGIHASLVVACKTLQLRPPSPERLRHYIGPPLRQYLPELLQLPAATSEAVTERLLTHFRHHHDREGWRQYKPYDGGKELLEELKAKGWELHLVTHKPMHLADQIQQESLGNLFQTLHAPGGVSWQGKSEALKNLKQGNELQYWYVGDTNSDRQAASEADYLFVAATYGFGHCISYNAKIVAPYQLLEVLG
jgi:phosphoglycolate phosphatase